MGYENKKLQVPATEENTQVEETNLHIEELEPRVAPTARTCLKRRRPHQPTALVN